MDAALIILAIVFILIAVRQIGSIRLPIWGIMLGGALAAFLFGTIPAMEAVRAIDIDVMLFLAGVFLIGAALERSGYLSVLAHQAFKDTKTATGLLIVFVGLAALASAFLMNDTLAVIGAPVALLLARSHRIKPALLLLALMFAVTIGSVASPIGNPQNLLIAIQGNLANPFVTFAQHLLLPTIINLAILVVVLRVAYRKEFHTIPLTHTKGKITDPALAKAAKWSLILLVSLVALKIALVALLPSVEIRLTWIALLAAVPVLVSSKRLNALRHIDWRTLVFFAAMFVLMAAVWRTSTVQTLLSGHDFTGTGTILAVSVLASQFISNVPLVALYLPVLLNAGVGTAGLMALAAGSTIAGNLLILGAASNIIVIQSAEARDVRISFWDFARIGIPLTILNVVVYWIFLVV